MEDKRLTPEQSFALIQQMIRQTHSRLERNAGTPFLIFGYVTVATSLAVWYAVTQTQNPLWQFLWFIIMVAGGVYWIFSRRKNRKKEVSTYVDRIISYIWITGGLLISMQSMIAMFVWKIPILYIIILIIGLQTALTGLIIKFRMVTIAGFTTIALSPLFLVVKGIDACLIFAAIFLVMMVIPGHILNYKSNHSKK